MAKKAQKAKRAEATIKEETKAVEQPVVKIKVDRRPYIAWVEKQLEAPRDRKELLKQILVKWPEVSKGGAQTFLTDLLNPKYTHWKDRPVVKLADGKVVFADKAPAPEVVVAPVVEAAQKKEVETFIEEAIEQTA